jgi:effector-binding domain-containing protein
MAKNFRNPKRSLPAVRQSKNSRQGEMLMKFRAPTKPSSLTLAATLGLAIFLAVPAYGEDQPGASTPPTTSQTTSPSPAPAKPSVAPAAPDQSLSPSAPVRPQTPPGAGPNEPEQGSPGVPNDATTETLAVPSRATAIYSGQAKWDDGFDSIRDAHNRIKAAVDKAGLKAAGSPITVFTQTDDNGFSYEAMLPIDSKPAGKDELTPQVKLGSSPSGKAIKFQHRGPYDDIDSTYDLITAYLDEKGLESRDFFIEEYLTDLTSPEDPNLAVDIYVFIK